MKKIALITDGWGRYVTYTWIQGYRNYMAAHQSDMDLYIFQSFGNFSMDEKHNAGEYNIARLPDFSEFDGILLDLATVSQPDLIAEIIERAGLLSIVQKNAENVAALIQQEGDETCLTRLMDAVTVTSEYKYFNIIEP